MRPLLAAVAALSLLVTTARPARACWDGYAATVGKVTFNVQSGAVWSAAEARSLAIWASRIDALLPAGATLTVLTTTAELCLPAKDGACDPTVPVINWRDGQLSDLFFHVAVAMHSSVDAVHHARAKRAAPLTLQVFASRAENSAAAYAARINQSDLEDLDGFYVAGGFPAANPRAHVVEGIDSTGERIYRVVVGAFLSQSEAAMAASTLRLGGFASIPRTL